MTFPCDVDRKRDVNKKTSGLVLLHLSASEAGLRTRIEGLIRPDWFPLVKLVAASTSALHKMDDNKMVAGKVKKPGKRGRKPAKIDLKAKLERSRQSARECRARKKLRYQYLEELVSSKERAICALREELEMYKQWCSAMDQGKIPSEIKALLTGDDQKINQSGSSTKPSKNSKNNISSQS
ncbi:cAMP-responsive element-binding protein-like 2 [Parambassis ranga]|uniref:cAMP-responsive element-binding protein-like 2 n=1 Tax=Parambassis ranga TaxID=210632 RepID=A0A6P7H616_9TELE|nr:cAMP-responsive element-binding protein-like 2 [Parambassis ranga]